MNAAPSTVPPVEETDPFCTQAVLSKLRSGKEVRHGELGHLRLHLDHEVPFLCIYRRPEEDEGHVGLNRLAACQTASMIVTGTVRPEWLGFVEELCSAMNEQFGGFLIVELWETIPSSPADVMMETAGSPQFEIRSNCGPCRTVETLQSGLERMRVHGKVTEKVRLISPDPPDDNSCYRIAAGSRGHWIGIGIHPLYRDPETGHLLPGVLAELESGLRDVLLRTFDAFCREFTSLRPLHFHSLGRRHFVEAVLVTDRHLERVARSFSFLLMVTPENSDQAWKGFRESKFVKNPVFRYRPLDVDPAILKRTLYDVDIEKIEDPVLARLFRQKQLELDRQITMLMERETPNFLYGSLQIYGGVDAELMRAAGEILELIDPDHRDRRSVRVTGRELLGLAEEEIAYYRARDPSFKATAELRDDLPPGMLVCQGKLLISTHCQVTRQRVAPLLHHEIGTHLLTYYNGKHQKLRLMYSGLAGYEGFQEGIALLSEFVSGGMSAGRLRLLAGRVVACQAMLSGATFPETFQLLVTTHHFPPRSAFTIVNRIFRGGGLTKDAVYLRGFREVCAYLADGGALEPLFTGKMALPHLPDCEELQYRSILQPPRLMPSWLSLPDSGKLLNQIRHGLTLKQLCRRFEYQ